MASMTHLGVGLAAKRVAPKTPVWVLIVAAYVIDFIWVAFYFLGIEHMPEDGVASSNPWSHGLFMALVWSLLAGLIAFWVSRKQSTGLVIGLLVFSHWVVDFISHPMTAVFPHDIGLPLLFEGSPLVGLGSVEYTAWCEHWRVWDSGIGTCDLSFHPLATQTGKKPNN